MPIAIGQRRHRALFQNPTNATDGRGGFTVTWASLTPPKMWVAIRPAAPREIERLAAGTVQSVASHIVTMPYHSGVTTKTRLTYDSRIFQVTGFANVEETGSEMVLTCVEIAA
jgi:SPP1 family predicted phage head-tail adaptor